MWIDAALDALARGGVAAVAVESIATRLKATKGSFYWHFTNRDALVVAALEEWERRNTADVIADLEAHSHPAVQLRELFHRAFGSAHINAVDAAVLADAESPLVAPVLDRVTRRRLAYLERAYSGLGLSPADAQRQALLAYTTYLGVFSLRRAAPGLISDDDLMVALEPLLSPRT
ncbi:MULTISPECIES: TetR/AcrR family transcriptional regulator [unclassified Pseudofrankia]|uniref:TetR/AcrR family transcriptional regulator n=1 Tax=unclassified Pseudofrankia TaxID=2994372 RepID=UPI0009F4AEE6|nr:MULTISPECIES: TetR/AcrR family transcriptional regulator [unclassified Pseudofrankia]MDT3441840.1 TetR/AcrR family transcriptional regulator [Pseudofrankia sp. BMG5.37]